MILTSHLWDKGTAVRHPSMRSERKAYREGGQGAWVVEAEGCQEDHGHVGWAWIAENENNFKRHRETNGRVHPVTCRVVRNGI